SSVSRLSTACSASSSFSRAACHLRSGSESPGILVGILELPARWYGLLPAAATNRNRRYLRRQARKVDIRKADYSLISPVLLSPLERLLTVVAAKHSNSNYYTSFTLYLLLLRFLNYYVSGGVLKNLLARKRSNVGLALRLSSSLRL